MKTRLPYFNFLENKAAGELRQALLREQHNMLRNILPPLYATMIIALIVFSAVFKDSMPVWFSIYTSAVFVTFMAIRMIYWFRSLIRGPEPELRKVQRDLMQVSLITPLMAMSYSALVIFAQIESHGEQMTIATIFIWSISLIISFSLSTLPFSSRMVTLGATLPISASFMISGDRELVSLGTVFITLSLLIIYINQVNYRSFIDKIVSRWQLVRKNKIMENERRYATEIAFTDNLTNLPNRRSFYDILDKNTQLFRSGHIATFAVAIIDLDGFKPVNDVHGHAVGDKVLTEVGRRLAMAIGGNGTVARLGGDEFAVIIHDVQTTNKAIYHGKLLCDSLLPEFSVGSVSAHLSGSCGFYIVNKTDINPSSMLERADLALYKAKSGARGSTEIFSGEMAALVLQHSQTEQALRKAINEDSIEVHFQPIVDLTSQKIIGMEALARWHHPELGSVPPARFIPIAEQTGLIAELTENLFKRALLTAKSWPNNIYLSFNLSADHLTRPTVGMNLLAMMLHHKFPPNRLEIEVTETAIMKDMSSARDMLTNLKQAGIKIALDDFGAGYSSIGQVRDLPFDKIKIDKSFMDGMCESKRTRNLVLSVIDMCRNLHIDCIAEGIEYEEQRQMLVDLGCRMGQGYLFARPMSADDSTKIFLSKDLRHSA